MDTCFQYLEETALSTQALADLIRRIDAGRKLLVFDACRNEVEGVLGDDEGLGKKRIEDFVTLYACQPRERAYIPFGEDLPVFTSSFIRAVKNVECRSMRDVMNLIYDQVVHESFKLNSCQTPEITSTGLDLSEIGFLSRTPPAKAKASSQYVETIRSVHARLRRLFEVEYPVKAPQYGVFMDAARDLMNWEQKIDHKTFWKIAFEFLEQGENWDLYTVSYMLRNAPDHIVFEPLLRAIASRKYRGTVIWQALSALDAILREGKVGVNLPDEISTLLGQALKRVVSEHPTRKGPLFTPTVVWGKALQITRRVGIPDEDVFPKEVIEEIKKEVG